MVIENLGSKLYSGTKADRKSDSLGSDADGSNTAITLVSGIKDYAGFDGSNDYINLGGAVADWKFFHASGAKYSVSMWIKLDTVQYTQIFTTEDNSESNGVVMYVNNSTSVGVQTWAGGSHHNVTVTTSEFEAGKWYHLVIARDGDDLLIYKDGTKTTGDYSGSVAGTNDASYVPRISGNHGQTAYRIDGAVQQTLVYTDALNQTEVNTLYNSGTPVTNPSTSANGNSNKLKAWYKFQSNADDSHGSFDGTATGITWVSDSWKLGTGAYSFNGSSSVVTTDQRVNGLHDGTGGSITFWVKKNSHAENDIIFATHNASGSGAGIEVKFNSSGNIKSTTTNNSSGWVDTTSTTALANDTWYHVAVTLDTDTKYRIYINGTLETTGSAFTPRTGDSSQAYTIGDNPSSGGWFDGDLDDMSIWSRALSATEISALVNTTLPSTATDSFNFSSSTGWSTSGQSDSEVDTSAGNLKYKGTGDSNDHRVSYDLTTVSDKQWKVRFIWNPTTTASSDGCGGSYYFYGLSDSTGAKTTSQDFIGIGMIGGDNLILTRSNGQSLQDGALGGGDLITGFSTGTTYYVTIERTSNDTITATVRTGSHTGTVAGTSRTYTDSSVEGITGLRYFKGCGYGSGSNVCGTTNQNIGTIDDLEIFNASNDGALVSSLTDKSNLKAYYSMDSTSLGATANYTTNFSSDTGWSSSSTSQLEVTNNELQIKEVTYTNNEINYDLSSQVSGSSLADSWVLRYDLEWSGSPSSSPLFWINIADNTAEGNENQDALSLKLYHSQSAGFSISKSDGIRPDQSGTGAVDLSPTTAIGYGTKYFIEHIRNGQDFTVNVRTGSHTGTLVCTGTISSFASTITGLKYFKIITYQGSGISGVLDNLEFYNGVSSLDGCKNDASSTSDLEGLTGVRTNSIFQQTDVPQYYWYNGTSWLLDGSPPVGGNLHAWYDASDSSTVTKDSSNLVSQLNDKSGNGYNLTASGTGTGGQPLWVSGGKNDLDIINFASSKIMKAQWSATAQPMTFVGFMYSPPSDGSQDNIWDNYDDTNSSMGLANDSSSNNIVAYAPTNLSAGSASNYTQKWGLFTIIYNTTSSSVSINGDQKASGNIGTNSSYGLTLSSHRTSATYGQIKLAELLIYNKVLSSDELASINNYFVNKWGAVLE